MPENSLNRFFVSIGIPSLLAILFFVLMIFLVILPSFERSNMDGKKEMISELTHTTLSLLEEYHREAVDGRLSADSARQLAARRIEQVRYGDESKDYFWIIDRQPVMIMHPYRPELIGKDLSGYQDPNGKLLFMEAVRLVESREEGYFDYMWQWKDDSTRIVPKLSYVREFEPWGWIVGTGIYLEDVRAEMRSLKQRLLLITLLFALLLSTILAFIIRQSLQVEKRRRDAEQKLQLSRLKYKSLVEASSEGTLMIVAGEIIFSNLKFSYLSGYSTDELHTMDFREILTLEWDSVEKRFDDPKRSVAIETTLERKEKENIEVVISLSKVSYGESEAYIIVVKEATSREKIETDKAILLGEMETSLQLLQQPIAPYVSDVVKIGSNASVADATALMKRKDSGFLLIVSENSPIGCVTDSDLRKRVLAEKVDPGTAVAGIMSAPVVTISRNTTLQEALYKMSGSKISHLAVLDAEERIYAYLGGKGIIHLLKNNLSFLTKEVEGAESAKDLKNIYRRLPALIRVLMQAGTRISYINGIVTTLGDAIHKRVVELALEEAGQPPCNFAFMVLGSQARGEQTLATDQDNAIVYEDKEDHEGSGGTFLDDYFLTLAEIINSDLNAIGYHYCDGDVMARNPAWTNPLSAWKEKFREWVEAGEPKDILDAGIFFDFRCAYGSEDLVDQLRKHVHELTAHSPVFFFHMAQEVIRLRTPSLPSSTAARSSDTQNKGFEVKKAMLPLVTFARLHAIQEKLNTHGTIARLRAGKEMQSIDETVLTEATHAFEVFMELRLRNQVEDILAGTKPGNLIPATSLSEADRSSLKSALSAISTIQSVLGITYKQS